jgi:hypothetical protein
MQRNGVVFVHDCVSLWHESPTTIVLNAEVLVYASPGSGPVSIPEDILNSPNLGNYPKISSSGSVRLQSTRLE